MSKPYLTRQGGATVTVFVPYDCGNRCPFCINKQEYENTAGFSAEKICRSIELLDAITPECDFVFTGGEPLADLTVLGKMLDLIPAGHRVFINTTLPVMQRHSAGEVVDFLNANSGKITCVNVSRHLRKYVAEGSDALFGQLKTPVRINCVLYGSCGEDELRDFLSRFRALGLPVQFRSDYTVTTPENLYDEVGDPIYRLLSAVFPCTGASGCRIRCNYSFGGGDPEVSYHKTLPYSTVAVSRGGTEYDALYDVVIKQNGDIHSDWTGTPLDVEKYRRVVFEPYDLHDFEPGRGGAAMEK